MIVQCARCQRPVDVAIPAHHGTVYIGRILCDSCASVERTEIAARPRYAEKRADQLIGAWQASGEVTLPHLRTLIIELIEEGE